MCVSVRETGGERRKEREGIRERGLQTTKAHTNRGKRHYICNKKEHNKRDQGERGRRCPACATERTGER